jgi:hypothetical protein
MLKRRVWWGVFPPIADSVGRLIEASRAVAPSI